MLSCPRCLFDDTIATIPPDGGQCNYCDIHDRLEADSDPHDLDRQLAEVRKGNGKYNCLIGISGGLDSSTLLWLAVRKWNLRPLVIHFNNGWNGDAATSNMNNLCISLGIVPMSFYAVQPEYDRLNRAFLMAGVPDADIPNDIAMTKLMYQTAEKHGIKWILNGHDFRQEGSTPASWTYMDAKYIQSVYRWAWGQELKDYPLFTFWDQVRCGIKGIKQLRPFHYMTDRDWAERAMKAEIGWSDYGGKHAENIYTEYVGADLLPKKFGIDKRIVYMSARVRSGLISRRAAKAQLLEPTKFDMDKLGDIRFQVVKDAQGPINGRSNFDRYDFRAPHMKLMVWALAKMKVVPYTFYVKYCR